MRNPNVFAVGIVVLFGAFSHAEEGQLQGNWVEVARHAPFSPRDTASGTVHQGRIWLVGGYDNVNNKNLSDVWYTEDGANWRQLKTTHQWQDRHEPTLYVFNDSLWLVAGHKWPVQNDVWKLELAETEALPR